MSHRTSGCGDDWTETADRRTRRSGPHSGVARVVAQGGLAILSLLESWYERARQRHRLAMLDDRALRDLGLSRADVWNETRKPFWIP